jgi:hypothetical protein
METASFKPRILEAFLMLRVVYFATRSSIPTASTVPISSNRWRNAARESLDIIRGVSLRRSPKTTRNSAVTGVGG